MDIIFLFAVFALAGVGANVFSKLCSNTVRDDSLSKYSLVLIINSIVACIFFAFSSGFSISVNGATLIYSTVYAFIVALSIVTNVIVYRYASISNVNVISNASGMVCTALVGVFLFSEPLGLMGVLRISVMLIAIFCIFIEQKKHSLVSVEPDRGDKQGHFLLLTTLIALISVASCANTVILKMYALSTQVVNENSFFFFTNVLLCIGSVVVFLFSCLRKKGEFREALSLFRPKQLCSIAGKTVVSNISSLISILIVAKVDMVVFSPVSSAIGIVVGVIGSLLFRERLGIFSYIAVIVSAIAFIL